MRLLRAMDLAALRRLGARLSVARRLAKHDKLATDILMPVGDALRLVTAAIRDKKAAEKKDADDYNTVLDKKDVKDNKEKPHKETEKPDKMVAEDSFTQKQVENMLEKTVLQTMAKMENNFGNRVQNMNGCFEKRVEAVVEMFTEQVFLFISRIAEQRRAK